MNPTGTQSAPHAGDLLSALVDGELDDPTAASVADHVRTCETCRQELDEIEAGRLLLRGLPTALPPEGFVGDLLGRRQRANRRGALLSVAAAVVAVVASVTLADPAQRVGPADASPPPSEPGGPSGERPYGIWRSDRPDDGDPSVVERIEDAAEDLLSFLGG